jgi:CRP-like cAMP-binding protein
MILASCGDPAPQSRDMVINSPQVVPDGAARQRALAELPLFQGLQESELRQIASGVRNRSIAPGRCAYRRGEEAAALYLVLSGRLRAVKIEPSGEEVEGAEVTAGDVFGEGALLDHRAHSSEVRAVEASEVLVLPSALLDDFFEHHPSRRLRLRTLAVTRRLAKVSAAFTD